jgi:phosphate transport system substrate-binding protein
MTPRITMGLLSVGALVAFAAHAASAAHTTTETLPDYRPESTVSGTLRSWGNPHMAALMKRWEAGFRKYQPGITFEDKLKSTAMGQWGLQEWAADMALMGRRIWPYEYYGTYRRSYAYPVEIAVATGSYDVKGKSTALTVFVHKDNPVTKLTLKQLDAIFGAQRTGGWQGLDWVRQGVARGPEGNIRTWGQLGLTGEWADKPIVPYGPPSLVTGAISFFQSRVSGGSDTRNEKLREYQDRALMARELSKDRYGIGYAGMNVRTADLKPVAIAEDDAGPYVTPTRASVANRTYPLTRTAYVYFTIDSKTGDLANPPVDPKVREFLRYVLSRQGQQEVAREGDYLPLTPALAREQLERVAHPDTDLFYRKDRR